VEVNIFNTKFKVLNCGGNRGGHCIP